MTSRMSSDVLWEKVVNEGVENRVEVNQRMLIDKMLARYSSDFVVYRELIQNSDDAQATSFQLEFLCDPTSSTLNYESTLKEETNDSFRPLNPLLDGLGQLFRNSWMTNSRSNPSVEKEKIEIHRPEFDFHNCLITEIRSVNNGHPFTEADWKRVATIAEGNTNADAIGQFGVGFFSVFSYSEKPMIQSGKFCLAFVWQNGKSLTTFRKELPLDEQTSNTSIILSMRNKSILQTKSTFETMKKSTDNFKSNQINGNRTAKSKKNTVTHEIVPTMDLTELKAYFTKVLSFTKHINELIIKINGLIVFKVNKTIKSVPSTRATVNAKRLNTNVDHNFLHFNSFVQTEQTFLIDQGPSITLQHVDVEASLNIDQEFHEQIQRVLKKSLPPIVHIQFLFPSTNIFEEEQWGKLEKNDLNSEILRNLIPLKRFDDKIIPSGQVFIGLATHQSTGIGMHVFSHLVPTIERENLDLQDPYISIWNEALLSSIGKITRLIYDQTILNGVNTNVDQPIERLNDLLAPFAFQQSVPNKDIGQMILSGFFSSDKDILVPVRRSPSDKHLSLIPSTEAFLSSSKYVELFLPIPLVPFEIGKNDFFKTLKSRRWIEEINLEIIRTKVHETILLTSEFIELLRWLTSDDIPHKNYLKDIFSSIRFRETRQSTIVKLDKLEFYDTLNIPLLPLPPNVLPSQIVNHFAREDLQRRLNLNVVPSKILVEFYLNENQENLWKNDTTSTILLSFLSQRWNQLSEVECTNIKSRLSNLKCIPTSQGLKTPNESYLRSQNLSPDLPIIQLYLPQILLNDEEKLKNESTDYPVSIEFLKVIGCRTIHVPTSNDQSSPIQQDSQTSNSQTLQTFVQDLLEKRKDMSENDLRALKNTACLIGTTLSMAEGITKRYAPHELHFPLVASRLDWKDLPIIDWPDIDPRSREYSFLKEIGVKEVPNLRKLFERILFQHDQQTKKKNQYKIPLALTFFAENFHQHYSKRWKESQLFSTAFLPSMSFTKQSPDDVFLSKPSEVFKEVGPLCPYVLPEVLQVFSLHFDLTILGVKQRPSIINAFSILMEKRNQLLNVESAPNFFAYLSRLDGLNRSFIDEIAKSPFIPLENPKTFVKVSEIFLRSKSSSVSDVAETRGLIDYVDFGSEANSFLSSVGVVSYPSADVLANLLIDRQSTFFSQIKENEKDVISGKVQVYLNCLKQLAAVANVARELNAEPLRSRLINKPWCLGFQLVERSDGTKDQIYKIARPADIYLDDDHQCAIDLRPLCAPEEPELTKLYERFGSKWLSESVHRTLIHRGRFGTTSRSEQLRNSILHRLDMLFVNNRGEPIEKADEKRIECLRTKLFVYESEGIQCQLAFQNRTVMLNSTECSSCALELERNKVALYINKTIPAFDYIDIASELTRFVYQKPINTIVHAMSDKLSSPLETLKRRGIPVDRLLKSVEQKPVKLAVSMDSPTVEQPAQNVKSPPSSQQQQQQQQVALPSPSIPVQPSVIPAAASTPNHVEHKHHPHLPEQSSFNQRGFLQSLKGMLFNAPTSQSVEPKEPTQSSIKRERVENFRDEQGDNDDDIRKIIRSSRPYSQREFNQSEHSKIETNNSCEFVPAANMIRHPTLFNGIPLYLDRNVILNNFMIDQAQHLSWLLVGLAKEVFQIPVETMHLFRDIDSARIAFNSNGSIFFNLRYFEQVYANQLKANLPHSASSSTPLIRIIVNFYYIVACHELSHNVDLNHDLNFIGHLEKVSVRFMDAKDAFLMKFSF